MTQHLSVHDPRGYPPKVEGKRLAPRLDSLEGKTVYLVDCLFDNSEIFMDEMMDWFGVHLPAVNTKIIKPRESWVDDPDMRANIEAGGESQNACFMFGGLFRDSQGRNQPMSIDNWR
jgi:hypothetical protein